MLCDFLRTPFAYITTWPWIKCFLKAFELPFIKMSRCYVIFFELVSLALHFIDMTSNSHACIFFSRNDLMLGKFPRTISLDFWKAETIEQYKYGLFCRRPYHLTPIHSLQSWNFIALLLFEVCIIMDIDGFFVDKALYPRKVCKSSYDGKQPERALQILAELSGTETQRKRQQDHELNARSASTDWLWNACCGKKTCIILKTLGNL